MPPAPYPDFRWFFRSLRVLPIVAIAALVGGIIGGFSVFALDLALTAPPRHDAGAETGKINTEKAASAAATAPAAGTSAPPMPGQVAAAAESKPPSAVVAPQPAAQMPAQGRMQAQGTAQAQTAPQIAVTPLPSSQQAAWPDALSREHKAGSATMTPATAAPAATVSAASQPAAPQRVTPQPAAAAAPRQAPVAQAPRAADSSSDQPGNTEIARKPIPTRWHIAVKRNSERTASEQSESSTRIARPVYDSYRRSDEAGPPDVDAKYRDTDRRNGIRRARADNDDDRSADGRQVGAQVEESDRDSALPPQPPPPLFFGLFGGGDRYDDQ